MLYLQWAITQIVESKVSLDRISKYLQAEDIKLDYIKKEENQISETAIKVENGNFYWLTEEEKMMKKEKEKEKEKKPGDKATVKEEKKKTDKRKVSGELKLNESSQNNEVQLDSEASQTDLENLGSSVLSTEGTGYKLILEDINLNIKKGSFVAILGE